MFGDEGVHMQVRTCKRKTKAHTCEKYILINLHKKFIVLLTLSIIAEF